MLTAHKQARCSKLKLGLLILGLSPPVLAQEAADDASAAKGLEEDIVTSQRREENLQDAPISVNAIQADMLTLNNINVQAGLSRITPNLTINNFSTFVSPYLRGVGSQFANPGLESSVAVYVDDLYQARTTAQVFAFNDLDRVEVLKGPQGTLYGRNATGGAFRVITKDPVPTFKSSFGVTTGRYDQRSVDGMVNVPFSDKLSGRLAVVANQRDGFINALTPGVPEMGNRDEILANGKLLYEPTEDFRAKLTMLYAYKRDRENQAFLNLDETAPTQIGIALGGTPSTSHYGYTGSSGPENVSRQRGATLRLEKDFDAFTLASISAFGRTENLSAWADLDTVDVPLMHAITSPEVTDDFIQELQIVSNGTGPWSWVAGLSYLREKNDSNFAVYGMAIDPSSNGVWGSAGQGIALLNRYRLNVSSYAVFAQGTYAFADRWSLTVGARYTKEEKEIPFNESVLANAPGLGTLPQFREVDKEAEFSRFSPNATLSFRPSDGLLLYLTASTGFKSGGFNLPSFGPAASVDPEILDAYELGWKFENDRLRFNGAAFYYDYKDLQVQFTDQATGGTRVDNAANSTIQGAEADLTLLVTRQFQIGIGVGYLDTEYESFRGDTYVPAFTTPACAADPAACLGYVVSSTDFSGRDMVFAPKLTGFVRGEYNMSLGSAGSLSASVLANYSDQYSYSPDGLIVEPSKTLVGASLLWTSASDRFNVRMFGDNLTNKEYHTWKTRQNTGGWRIPALPRTWGIRLGVNF